MEAGAGSADSSAPVMDWKPVSLVEVMAMLFRRMATALGACCAPGWCCSAAAAVNNEECLDSTEVCYKRLGENAARIQWPAPQRRMLFAVDAGELWRAACRCLHWQRGCGAGRYVVGWHPLCRGLRCDEA